MQEEYTGELLEDGHLSIPTGIINKLKINKGSRLRVTVQLEEGIKKQNILDFAGLLSDLNKDDEKIFDDSVKRRSFFTKRQVDI